MLGQEEKLPDLPEDVFLKIVTLVGEDRWWVLGPILRAGQRGKKAVYNEQVFKAAAIYCLCTDPSEINTSLYPHGDLQIEWRNRRFFLRCYDSGNKIAIYYEGLRVMAEERDLASGICILSRNVPEEADATLACGVLSICQGNEEKVVRYPSLFGANHYPLLSGGVRRIGRILIYELSRYRMARDNMYEHSYLYPSGALLPSPDYAEICYSEFRRHYRMYENTDIFCKHRRIWWLSKKICEIL